VREDGVTRRGLIAGAAVAGAAAALPEAAGAKAKHRKKRKPSSKPTAAPLSADVVVVGAGFAGLTAALRVLAAGKSVIVLEARDRVGGRALNMQLPGGEVSERGATYVGPTQDRILALAQQFGVKTFDAYDSGDNVYVAGGTRSTYSDTGLTGTAPLDVTILPELALTVSTLDQMSTTVPVNAPWEAPDAGNLDAETLKSWLDQNSLTQKFKNLVTVATRPIFGAESGELSLLFVLFYIASSGNEQNPGTFERNFNTRGGAQMSRFVGGSQLIAIKAAERLGKRVMLGQPVRRISVVGTQVTVTTDSASVNAKRVIVAIPPALAGRIDYEPGLPPERDQLTQRFGMGALTKVAAVYDRAFWRDAGLTGTAVSSDGLVQATFDDSPPGGAPGVVFGFVGGISARSYQRMAPDAGRAAVLAQFAQFFGPQALKPTAYFDTRWSNETWTRGCPVGIPAPGALTAYGPWLRRPIGPIHWAGTETSNFWNGYMDGAVRSGERAAGEVLAAL
jgi:monoamine oxidase